MLNLTRRRKESLRIGDDVLVLVNWIDGGQVGLAIEAPKHVMVHREELYQKLKAEKAAGGPGVRVPTVTDAQAATEITTVVEELVLAKQKLQLASNEVALLEGRYNALMNARLPNARGE